MTLKRGISQSDDQITGDSHLESMRNTTSNDEAAKPPQGQAQHKSLNDGAAASLKPFTGTIPVDIKPAFEERFRKLTDWDEFKRYSLSFLRKSIRVNTLKATVTDVKRRLSESWKLETVPWCPEGFFIEHKEGRLDVGNTIEHCLGYYYVQEAASMIPPVVLAPEPGDRVLDMAASPGSKTTQMAAMMRNTGVIVANDVTGDRLAALGINVTRVGAANVTITQMKGQGIREVEFDRILLDAPCSGTGTIRKSWKTLRMWNPAMVTRLSATQRQLVDAAWKVLRPGGTLVYSTCSLEPEEDEGVVSYLLNKYPDASIEPIDLPLKRGTPITEFDGETYHPEVKHVLRLWPQDNDTEGFFVAKFTKAAR